MATEPDLSDTIAGAAQAPSEAAIDGMTTKAHPIPDVIAADKYLKGEAALASGRSGWGATRPARVVPPGSIGLNGSET